MSRAPLAHHAARRGASEPPPPGQTTIYVDGVDDDNGNHKAYTLQNPAQSIGAVIFQGGSSANTPGVDWDTVPTKSLTITNNSNNHDTIYPFLYDSNSTPKYDPMDVANDEYRLYIGYDDNGNYVLGLPYGKTVTFSVPLVFWNAGRADLATDGPHLIPEPGQVNDLNPYQFYYTASTYISNQYVTRSDDNGYLMYYKANTVNAPNDPSPAGAGQLTEWTIRDQNYLSEINDKWNKIKTPNDTIANSELTNLVNYDVSYVDDMTSPVAMKALNVPIPIQRIQNGTYSTQGGTTTITLPDAATAFVKLLTKTYPYGTDQWMVKYNDPSSKQTTFVGQVMNISNGVITISGSASGLPTNLASYVFYTNSVTADYGVDRGEQ